MTTGNMKKWKNPPVFIYTRTFEFHMWNYGFRSQKLLAWESDSKLPIFVMKITAVKNYLKLIQHSFLRKRRIYCGEFS